MKEIDFKKIIEERHLIDLKTIYFIYLRRGENNDESFKEYYKDKIIIVEEETGEKIDKLLKEWKRDFEENTKQLIRREMKKYLDDGHFDITFLRRMIMTKEEFKEYSRAYIEKIIGEELEGFFKGTDEWIRLSEELNRDENNGDRQD